ncbi:hypothetical protein TR51_05835 [Kitasatospora griseola]|uniref:Uncharacterized protein n=1 Tax=Kitasatospora griseola TaxID=2064 RepID=A0A0D0NF68_KITGR|nr:hypothetical protein [Kitasatospora griseola]KIQ66935.1 hypothetical protein TR51_05835 [Kitasatospora griseola]
MTAVLLTGLALALAAPAAGHAADGARQIGVGGAQQGSVAIPGQGLANPADLIWDGNTSGSTTVGGGD